ncbi:Chitinase [Hahella chejuensis KCTC 2396]|uniref:chitinase n=1 Tax=Hahella chejuensis (strain KCTC 2396) TaxID=349521 RepID=Q2SNL2_HAHCH|nr:Ig-like domain-containing protein [Hahella chejuensis]ABC27762.1 Chitinase [Hahella chejuensis KCTC 2396]
MIKQGLKATAIAALIAAGPAMAYDCAGLSNWDAAAVYVGGKTIQHKQNAYTANWWNQGADPEVRSGQWQEWKAEGACDGPGGNQRPSARLTSPSAGQSFKVGATVAISAEANDADGSVSSVAFFVDGAQIAQDATAPYAATWTATAGEHSLKVVATDDGSAQGESATISINVSDDDTQPPSSDCDAQQYAAGTPYANGDHVQNLGRVYECKVGGWCSSSAAWAYEPGKGLYWEQAWGDLGVCSDGNAAPTVSLTSPADGAIILSGTAINLQANASDSDGVITEVAFYNGSNLLGSTVNTPYAYEWMNAPVGQHTLTAVAKDDGGKSTTSDSVTITVSDEAVAAAITSPQNNARVTLGASVSINASASSINGDIAKVEFFVNGASISSDASAPYQSNWTPNAEGQYQLTVTATDKDGYDATSAPILVTVLGGKTSDRVIVGYWHNFDNGSGFVRLPDVSPDWDVIDVAFATPKLGSHSDMEFSPFQITPAQMKADIAAVQARGQKVIISIGGAEAIVRLTDANAEEEFVDSMTALIREYGFDGFDIDLEGSSLSLDAGDTDFKNPKSPVLTHLISASKRIISNFGGNLMLTMAPETYYVQGGFSAYGGGSGAYLPVIHALRNELSFIHVQHYNSGCMLGLDGKCYSVSTGDFHVAMAEMLLAGFPVGGNANNRFPPLPAEKVAIGLPASTSAAGSGYTLPSVVHQAVNYLVKGQSFGGSYQLQNPEGYPGFKGLMTWSINWDRVNNNEYLKSHKPFLNGL